MARQSGPEAAKAAAQAGKEIDKAVTELTVFQPTAEMRRVKSKILSRMSDDPTRMPGSLLTRSSAEQLAGRSLESWWSKQGFQEWLSNATEFTERLEGIALQAMDTLEDVMENAAQDSARVNAAKVAMELASKFPRQKLEKDPNEFLSMEPAKIIEFLKLYAPQVLKQLTSGEKNGTT